MSNIPAPWTIKRELLTKSEAETNPNYGQKPEDRPYPDLVRFGVINLDKPPGPTSHEVAAWVRRILDVKQGKLYNELVKLSKELLTEGGTPIAKLNKADLMLPLSRVLRIPFEAIIKGDFGE